MAWLSLPGTLLGRIEVPQHFLVHMGQQEASGFRPPYSLPSDIVHLDMIGDAAAGTVPAAAAAAASDHLEWWHETQLHVPGAPAQQPPQQQGGAGSALAPWEVAAQGSLSQASLMSPFASTSPLPPSPPHVAFGGGSVAGGGVGAPADGLRAVQQMQAEGAIEPAASGAMAAAGPMHGALAGINAQQQHEPSLRKAAGSQPLDAVPAAGPEEPEATQPASQSSNWGTVEPLAAVPPQALQPPPQPQQPQQRRSLQRASASGPVPTYRRLSQSLPSPLLNSQRSGVSSVGGSLLDSFRRVASGEAGWG
jgi:hypothetical protein